MPKNYLTYLQADTLCLSGGGIVADRIPVGIRQMYLNNELMKLYDFLNNVDDPWYDRSTVLTVAADQEHVHEGFVGDEIVSINTTTKIITLDPAAIFSFVVGQIIFVALDNRGVAIGGGADMWYTAVGRITVGGDTATYEVISSRGTPTTTSGTITGTVTVFESSSLTTADISSLYVKDIKHVQDDAGAAGVPRIFFPVRSGSEFNEIAARKRPFYDKLVAWNQIGDTVRLSVGSTATALAIVTMEYRGKPAIYTDASENTIIDIPPERNEILLNETQVAYMQHAGFDIPVDLQQRHDATTKVYTAAAVKKAEELERRGRHNV